MLEHKIGDGGAVEEITDDNRLTLLNADTGDTLNGYELKKAMVTDYLLGGGGYAYVEKKRNDVTDYTIRHFRPMLEQKMHMGSLRVMMEQYINMLLIRRILMKQNICWCLTN